MSCDCRHATVCHVTFCSPVRQFTFCLPVMLFYFYLLYYSLSICMLCYYLLSCLLCHCLSICFVPTCHVSHCLFDSLLSLTLFNVPCYPIKQIPSNMFYFLTLLSTMFSSLTLPSIMYVCIWSRHVLLSI